MSRIVLVVTLSVLVVLAALSTLVVAAPTVDLSVTNVDGTWSNPSPGGAGVVECFLLQNTGSTTDENKISAGEVNDPASNGYPAGACYTDAPPNGPGFSEGSGFGFDGAINSATNVTVDTPFLVGVLVHYNRRILTGLDGAQLNVAMAVTGGTPSPVTVGWDVALNETNNRPANNAGDTCPYPASTFYSATYLAFNGGFNDTTQYPAPAPFGELYTHPNVSGNPPFAERTTNQWLCGDAISASSSGGGSATVNVGGVDYTLELLGVTYPISNPFRQPLQIPGDVNCGPPPDPSTLDLVLETKELNDTLGCVWGIFTAPTAVTVAEPVSAAPQLPTDLLAAVAAMAGVILLSLVLWRRRES